MTNNLASLFFIISDSLLWPVMLGLTAGLALAIWRCGATAREAFERFRRRKLRAQILDALRRRNLSQAEELLRGAPGASGDPALATLLELFDANDDVALVENALATARNLNAERSTSLRVLMKLGPAFGLMGTLIPLGPASVGIFFKGRNGGRRDGAVKFGKRDREVLVSRRHTRRLRFPRLARNGKADRDHYGDVEASKGFGRKLVGEQPSKGKGDDERGRDRVEEFRRGAKSIDGNGAYSSSGKRGYKRFKRLGVRRFVRVEKRSDERHARRVFGKFRDIRSAEPFVEGRINVGTAIEISGFGKFFRRRRRQIFARCNAHK